MYRVYHTTALVLDTHPVREADAAFVVVTKDLGVLRVIGKGIRKLSSKLRYSMHRNALCEISVLYGKAGWRLVGAVHTRTFQFSRTHNWNAAERVAGIVCRLAAGEEENKHLFADVLSAFALLSDEKNTSPDPSDIELLTTMRILNTLGYWGNTRLPSYLLTDALDEPRVLNGIREQKAYARNAVHRAIEATQL